MSSNKTILLSLSIAFIVSITLFFILYSEFPDTHVDRQNHQFFDQKLEGENIFLIGSSHVNQLNTTHIHNEVSKNSEKFTVYNLAINADDPRKRLKDVEKIISLEPRIIFYGISYRDFSSSEKEQQQITSISLDINPKFSTMQAIRATLSELGLFQEKKDEFTDINSPFKMIGEKQTVIQPKEIIEIQTKEQKVEKLKIESNDNEQVNYFKEIISKFQDNDIEVIVFTTPVSQSYFEKVPKDGKNNFKLILNEIEEEFDIKMYNFTTKFSDLNIWQNPTHVAFNPDSIIFSKEIAKMIMQEIDK